MPNKSKITLSKKYMILGSIAILAIVSAFTVINTHTQNRNLKLQKLEEAKNIVKFVEVAVADDIADSNGSNPEISIEEIKKSNDAIEDILIYDNMGIIIAGPDSLIGKPLQQTETTPGGKSLQDGDMEIKSSSKLIRIYSPIVYHGKKLGGIKITYTLEKLSVLEYELLTRNILIGLVVFVVCMLLLMFFVGKIIRPVQKLIEGTRTVAEGNYEKKIDIKTGDELEVLSSSFNRMVDELKSSHDEMIAALEKSERSDRLKSEFLAQMSHEIRTPINSIVNFSGLVRTELAPYINRDLSESFDIINDSCARLIRTIELIIDASELQTGNFQVKMTDLIIFDDIIDPVIKELNYAAIDKGLSLSCNNSVGPAMVSGDKYSITQLFTNLIDNAIKYTNSGYINVNISFNAAGDIVIEVEDTGIGISEDFLPFLFEPFMQEDQGYSRMYEGTGLGLSLVKKYSELNNAEVKVESRKGEGTKFTVTFSSIIDN